MSDSIRSCFVPGCMHISDLSAECWFQRLIYLQVDAATSAGLAVLISPTPPTPSPTMTTPVSTYNVCLYICLYVRLCVCLYVRLFVCTSVCLYVFLSVRLFVDLSVCLFVCTSVCLRLYVYLSVCLYVCLSICLYVCCLYVCVYVPRFRLSIADDTE